VENQSIVVLVAQTVSSLAALTTMVLVA
jgi:hypothetical protein